MPLKVMVNNEARTVDVPPDTPLLWVLRDILTLKAPNLAAAWGFAAPALCWWAAMRCAPA